MYHGLSNMCFNIKVKTNQNIYILIYTGNVLFTRSKICFDIKVEKIIKIFMSEYMMYLYKVKHILQHKFEKKKKKKSKYLCQICSLGDKTS